MMDQLLGNYIRPNCKCMPHKYTYNYTYFTKHKHTHTHTHTHTYIIIIIIILFIIIKYLESNSYALQQSPQARPTKKEVNSTSKTLERERERYIYILEMGSKVTLTIVWLGGGICAIEGGRRGGGRAHESTRLSGGQPKWRNHAANKRG